MASGDSLLQFRPQDNEPPATNYALQDKRNQHPILVYDDTSNWDGVFTGIMPQHYAGITGITVYIHWSHVAIVNDVDWDVAFERIGDQQQDMDADGFAAANSVDNNTVPGNSGDVDIVSVAFTDGADMDSIAVGELFRMKVTRDAASDTAVGNAQLRGIEIRET